ncbi:MAG: hypothetical protein MUC69_02470, partial [Gemmatimonadales bacterium]|nr:hypothetical protein [Gemmatimonadales bacterium]
MTESRHARGKVLAAGLAALALLGLLGWLAVRRPATPPTAAVGPADGGAARAATGPMSEAKLPAMTPGTVGKGFGELRVAGASQPAAPDVKAESVKHWTQNLEQYREFAKYPPWSRPATDTYRDRWDWNRPSKATHAVARDAQNQPISGELTLDRWFAGPGEAITATLRVWSGRPEDGEGEAVPFTAKGAVVARPEGEKAQNVGELAFVPVPGAAGQQQTRFVPSALPGLRTRNVQGRVVVNVTTGDRTYRFEKSFGYAADRVLVIERKEAEAIVNGSLEVRLKARVTTPGPASIVTVATLFDARGERPLV